MSYGLPSLDEQLRRAREAAGASFLWAHIDTCLACYLGDHHNRDGELLLGVYVDGDSTIESVINGLAYEFRQIAYEMGESRAGYDHDAAKAALDRIREENADRMSAPFASSLETPSDDDDGGESVQAWFLLTWDVPEEGGDASA